MPTVGLGGAGALATASTGDIDRAEERRFYRLFRKYLNHQSRRWCRGSSGIGARGDTGMVSRLWGLCGGQSVEDQYGGGGGGGSCSATTSTRPAVPGRPGIVYITEYIQG